MIDEVIPLLGLMDIMKGGMIAHVNGQWSPAASATIFAVIKMNEIGLIWIKLQLILITGFASEYSRKNIKKHIKEIIEA